MELVISFVSVARKQTQYAILLSVYDHLVYIQRCVSKSETVCIKHLRNVVAGRADEQ